MKKLYDGGLIIFACITLACFGLGVVSNCFFKSHPTNEYNDEHEEDPLFNENKEEVISSVIVL